MREFKEYTGDHDIFVPKIDERSYLKKHDIEVAELSNGIRIFAATRKVEDDTSADIAFHFLSGAYHEPKGKSGINHILEHMISNVPGFISRKTDAYYNAVTGYDYMQIIIKGIANPQVRNYGVWPVVPSAISQILNNPGFSRENLEHEKSVVIGEMYQRNADHNQNVSRLLYKVIFGKSNPMNYQTIGTEKDIRSITLEDVEKQHRDVFIPNETLAGLFVQGNSRTTDALMDILKEEFSKMKNENKKPKKVDKNLSADINPNFEQGKIYKLNTGLNNKTISVNYIWLTSLNPYSIKSFAQSKIFELAQQKVFRFFRESGLGYTTTPIDIGAGDQKRALGFQMILPKTGEPLDSYPDLNKAIFDSFTPEDIDYINNQTHVKLQAIPISVSDRYSDVIHGFQNYGRIIDTDKVPAIHKSINNKDLRAALEDFKNTPPAIIVIGDL